MDDQLQRAGYTDDAGRQLMLDKVAKLDDRSKQQAQVDKWCQDTDIKIDARNNQFAEAAKAMLSDGSRKRERGYNPRHRTETNRNRNNASLVSSMSDGAEGEASNDQRKPKVAIRYTPSPG